MNHISERKVLAAAALALALAASAAEAPAAQAQPVADAPALTTGRAVEGPAFRLEGNRLTVTLKERLAPRRSRLRPSVKLICGMAAPGAEDSDRGLAFTPFAIAARRDLRIAAGVRTIRARLSADVARWVTLCGIRWQSRGGSGTALAAMTLRHGTPAGCTAPPGAAVVESNEVLMLDLRVSGEGDGWAQDVACVKPDGAWRLLDTSSWDKYFNGRYLRFAAAGSWIGWSAYDTSPGEGPSCAVRRVDLAGGGEIEELPVTTPGFCALDVAIGPNGLLAWIARVGNDHAPLGRVQAVAVGGAIVTLATGGPPKPLLGIGYVPPEQFTDLAIGPDGTVTWREDGVLRSASV